MGVLNLLQVVNKARSSSCKAQGAGQFFRLLLKPYVYSVWLARGGRKRVENTKNLTDHLLN